MGEVEKKMRQHHCWDSREPFRVGDMASFCGVSVDRINQVCNSLQHDGVLYRCRDGQLVVRASQFDLLRRKWA